MASEIVDRRPWLDISWITIDDHDHLVVHDGPHGAALHFDDELGPTWAPRTSSETPLHWDEVLEVNQDDPTTRVAWSEHWGPAGGKQLSGKTITYSLIAHLLDSEGVAALPAKVVHDSDESANAPGSAFTLIDSFTTLRPTVQWYVSQLASASWGAGAVWHEPLWLITRDGQPILVLDEAGHAHLTMPSLGDVIAVMACIADLGGIPDPTASTSSTPCIDWMEMSRHSLPTSSMDRTPSSGQSSRRPPLPPNTTPATTLRKQCKTNPAPSRGQIS